MADRNKILDIPDVLSDSLWEKAYPIFQRLISNDMTGEEKAVATWNILQVMLAYEDDDSLESQAKEFWPCYSHRFNYDKWLEDYKQDKNPYRLKDQWIVIFGDYHGRAMSKQDLKIYNSRLCSACLIYDNKLLDREKNKMIDAPGYCVADFQDGDMVNFKKTPQD